MSSVADHGDSETLGSCSGQHIGCPDCDLIWRALPVVRALRVIAGPADDHDPFMDTYRKAGGGYGGLQAIAEEALRAAGDDRGTQA